MRNRRVLISGSSIAGPALAHWLHRYGFDVTVVEKAPGLRPGGQAVDFKGLTHRTVLERMGILDEVRARQTGGGPDGIVVDRNGRRIATVPAAFGSGEIEIARGELTEVLHRLTADTVTYRFGDTITGLTQTPDGVEVTFAHAAAATYDLVVGADGIHSKVRALTCGPDTDFVRHLGYYYALADIPTDGDWAYSEPGRTVMAGGPKAPAFFVFAADRLDVDRDDVPGQKAAVQQHFRGAGWKVPEMLTALPDAGQFYLDAICRAVVPAYSDGRVVLLGDAAYGNTLGGFGTGLAVVGAYVLAGELALADGDHVVGFARYETAMRRYATVAGKVNAGRILAPRTRLGLRLRNLLFTTSFLFAPLMKLSDRFATDIELLDYPTLLTATPVIGS